MNLRRAFSPKKISKSIDESTLSAGAGLFCHYDYLVSKLAITNLVDYWELEWRWIIKQGVTQGCCHSISVKRPHTVMNHIIEWPKINRRWVGWMVQAVACRAALQGLHPLPDSILTSTTRYRPQVKLHTRGD